MRSLMIVAPHEFLDGAAPRVEGQQRPDVEVFVVNRPKEALNVAIRLRRVGPQDEMPDLKGH
jgi:hypothetical protein